MAASGATAGESVCAGRTVQQHPRWLAPGPAWISCRWPCQPARARLVGGAAPLQPQWSPARRLFGRGRHRQGAIHARASAGRRIARAGAKRARD